MMGLAPEAVRRMTIPEFRVFTAAYARAQGAPSDDGPTDEEYLAALADAQSKDQA
jgi:hypothetical protein